MCVKYTTIIFNQSSFYLGKNSRNSVLFKQQMFSLIQHLFKQLLFFINLEIPLLFNPSSELTKYPPLAISPQLFHFKPKTLLFLIHPLLPTSLPVSTPNTIHHSRLTVCLSDSLNLTSCLSILFWTSACE